VRRGRRPGRGGAALIVVELTPDELYIAGMTGIHRRICSIRARAADQSYTDPTHSEWATDIEAAAAELAVAKILNRYPTGLTQFSSVDVSKTVHIRHTTRDNGSLIVRDRDPRGVFIFVTGHAPRYEIHGFIKTTDAKREEWLRAPNGGPPAYFVPRAALTPLKAS
jgi:hypothetical protein